MIPCPKCGSTSGWEGPTYRTDFLLGIPRAGVSSQFLQWLGFSCQVCGYERREPTADGAQMRVRPQADDWLFPYVFGALITALLIVVLAVWAAA